MNEEEDLLREIEDMEKNNGAEGANSNELKELEELERESGTTKENDELKELEEIEHQEKKQHKAPTTIEEKKQRVDEINQQMANVIAEAKKANNQQKLILKQQYEDLAKEKAELSIGMPQAKTKTAAPPKVNKKEQAMKLLQVELVLPPSKPYNDISDEEAEEVFHKANFMLASSVMEAEKEIMEKMGEQEYAKMKISTLDMNIMVLQKKVETGTLSLEKYGEDIKRELAYENQLIELCKKCKAPPKHINRITNRIAKINTEITDLASQQDDQEKEQPVQPKVEQPKVEQPKVEQPKVEQSKLAQPKAMKEPINLEKEEIKESSPTVVHVPDPPPIDMSSSIVIKKEEINFSKVDKEQYDKIHARLEEYRAAAQYYHDNGIQQQAVAMITVAKKLKQYEDVLKGGHKVDMLRVEPPLLPDAFLGVTPEKKHEQISNLAKLFKIQADMFTKMLNEQKERVMKFPEIKKDKTFINLINEFKNHYDVCQINIKNLVAIQADKWTPVPKAHKGLYTYSYQIINYEIKPGNIQIHIINDPAMKLNGSYYYLMSLGGGESEKIEIRDREITREGPIQRAVLKKQLILQMKEKAIFGDHDKGVRKFDLLALEKNSTVEIPTTFGTKHVYNGKIILKIRQSYEPESYTENKEIYFVDTFYPSFRGAYTPFEAPQLQYTASTIAQPKKAQVKKVSESIISKKPAPPKAVPQGPISLPEGITKADIVNPDNVGNLVS